MHPTEILLLIFLLLICGITDILKNKIYNAATFPAILMGLALNYHYFSLPGLLSSFLGLLISSVIFIILFAWGGFGAGDVKLMMAIGAIAGYKLIFDLILYSSLAGGVMANVVLIKNKRFIQSWNNVFRFFLFLIPKTHFKKEPIKRSNSLAIPYGYAIAMGSLVYLYFSNL